MYGKLQEHACPMCAMWIDGFDAVHSHVAEHADFVVVAAAEPAALSALASERGWSTIPLYSADESTFKFDLGSEDAKGQQSPTVSVFARSGGDVVHVYSGRPDLSEDMTQRGIDQLSPVWNLLDLLPTGRGEWYPA